MADEAWVVRLETIVAAFQATGEPPARGSPLTRTVNYACTPVFCFPCIVWSTLWRLLCCPIQCCSKGPGFILSNNGCTDGSDKCIGMYIDEVSKSLSLGPTPRGGIDPRLHARVAAALDTVEHIFAQPFKCKEGHYKLAASLFGVTPSQVCMESQRLRMAQKLCV